MVKDVTENMQKNNTFEEMNKFYNNDRIKASRGIFFSNAGANFAKEYGESYSSLLAKKVNQCLSTLSKNPNFREQLINMYNNHQEVTADEFKKIVVNSVVDEVLSSKLNENSDIIPESIINKLQKEWLSASEELEKNIDFIALKVSQLSLDNKKKEIKDEYII